MARILILEKDPIAAWELQGELVLGGQHDVVVEDDPRRALELVHEQPFDLVLADWAGVDGGWFCQKVRAHRIVRTLPVILLGPEQDLQDPAELEHLLRTRYGCHDFVQRPIDFEALRELIASYVRIREAKARQSERETDS